MSTPAINLKRTLASIAWSIPFVVGWVFFLLLTLGMEVMDVVAPVKRR